MYAIIQLNGQQFKVEAGKTIFVHHIAGSEAGQEVEVEDVLLVDKEGAITVGMGGRHAEQAGNWGIVIRC
ncbi:MAG: bL21 family ribosomal protein, partial [Bacteroidaceae bacterium]